MDFKWLTVPFTNKTRQTQAVQLWEVRWHSVKVTYKGGSCRFKPEIEAFTNSGEAESFANSLRKAFSLVRLSGEGLEDVEVIKAK